MPKMPGCAFIGVAGGQHQHALAQAKLHLARCQVRHHHRQFAHQLLGLVHAGNAAEDVARFAFAHIQRQLQQLRWKPYAWHSTILAMRVDLAKSSMPMVGAISSPPGLGRFHHGCGWRARMGW